MIQANVRQRQRRCVRRPEPCPNGATSISPGLAQRAYLGSRSQNDLNPNGVGANARRWTQPLQGWIRGRRVPRVARASQPWARLRNPVGIRETATAGTAE